MAKTPWEEDRQMIISSLPLAWSISWLARFAQCSRRAGRNEVEINNRKFSGNLEELEQYRKDNNHPKRGRKPKGFKETTIVNADGERVLGCIRGQESLLISPIIHWSDSDVWTFLNTLGIAHCELYDQGFHRIGCIGCPMSQPRQKAIENKRWPHVKRNWIKAIKAIRQGGVFKREFVWWNIPSDLTPCRNVGNRLRKASLPNNASTRDFGQGFQTAPLLTA